MPVARALKLEERDAFNSLAGRLGCPFTLAYGAEKKHKRSDQSYRYSVVDCLPSAGDKGGNPESEQRSKPPALVGLSVARQSAETVELLYIAVLEECRGMGYATGLLDRLVCSSREMLCKEIVLEVRQSNDAARKLYENFDFKLLGERPAYYPALETGKPRETAIIYRLALDSKS